MNKTLLIILFAVLVIAGLLLIVLTVVYQNQKTSTDADLTVANGYYETPETLIGEGILLNSKPVLSGEIATNPDFVYPNRGWLIEGVGPVVEILEPDWESDGFYDNRTAGDRNNFIVMHPHDIETGSFIERTFYLPNDSYNLVVGIADIAGRIYYAEPTACNDVGFLIKIIEDGETSLILNIVIDSEDGWVDLSFDISSFANKEIKVRVESYAGGPCGDWSAEWAAVDYIDILKS